MSKGLQNKPSLPVPHSSSSPRQEYQAIPELVLHVNEPWKPLVYAMLTSIIVQVQLLLGPTPSALTPAMLCSHQNDSTAAA